MKVRLHSCVACLLGLTALSLTPRADAGIIFQTGFESSEALPYSIGQLSGQNGWSGSTFPVVENSTVFSGSQAVSFAAPGSAGPSLIHHGLTYDSLSDPSKTVVFDMEFMASSSGTPSVWDVFAISGNLGFIGELLVLANGNARLANGTATGNVPVTRGIWNDFQMVLDFQSQTMSAYVNSQFIASDPFASASTSLSVVQFGINSNSPSGTSDIGSFDQLSVTGVPEPGYTALMAAGIALIAFRSRRLAGQLRIRC